MGVPAFFRWLSKKYPSIVVHCVEEKKKNWQGETLDLDASKPNPNDVEFDNLYLDMNGIIHPCCHPENKPAPKNEDEMMVEIFEYIDRLFSIVRPRKLLYMAIDGVAPRAKMNQQRSRRFRAAKEAKESAEDNARIKQQIREKGGLLPPEKEKGERFDSNCITPGTPFMAYLSDALKYYITERLNSDPGWKGIKVILSDANVPGEGEHKIMDYIRKQRAHPDHDPNTRHCLNGADADLIMLGLATHEPHFTIIREEFKPNQKKPCEICAQIGHEKDECEGLPKGKEGEFDELSKTVGEETTFIFIRLNVLREYLEKELKMEGLPFTYDFDRCLDDWVFMCFFVGNDFLPHLPSLEIRENAIDRLVTLYKKHLPRLGAYVTEGGIVDLNKAQIILNGLGEVEDEIFVRRQENELRFRKRQKDRERAAKRQKMMQHDYSNLTPLMNSGSPGSTGSFSPASNRSFSPRDSYSPRGSFSTPPRGRGRQGLGFSTPSYSNQNSPMTPGSTTPVSFGRKRGRDEMEKEEEDDEPKDDIRLWEDGWKSRYYTHKFGISEEDREGFDRFRKHVAMEYVRGLCWVLRYYFQGCPSWKWYFPYHYAPFASDFVNIAQLDSEFEVGTQPFNPLEQLMSVFPAASGKFLPPTWRDLMSNPESPIIDFYPSDFKVDLNGKKWAWQGVALLPFVDEKRLLNTVARVYPDLTDAERHRNSRDLENLFCGPVNPLTDYLVGLYEGGMLKEKQDLVAKLSLGVRGKIVANPKIPLPKGTLYSPVKGLQPIPNIRSVSVKYHDPIYPDGYIFPIKLLENVSMPDRVLKPSDFPSDKNYRPQTGMSPRSHNPYHVSPGGHRMVNHQVRNNSGSPSRFSPPSSYSPSAGYSPRSSYSPRQNRTPPNWSSYGSQNTRSPSPSFRGMSQRTPSPLLSDPIRLGLYQNQRRDDGYSRNSYGQSNNRNYSDSSSQNQRNGSNSGSQSSQDPRRHSFPTAQNRYRPY